MYSSIKSESSIGALRDPLMQLELQTRASTVLGVRQLWYLSITRPLRLKVDSDGTVEMGMASKSFAILVRSGRRLEFSLFYIIEKSIIEAYTILLQFQTKKTLNQIQYT